MRILARNARFGHKEFDLVAKDDDFIVFVEVKTSRTDKYGDPSEWVTARKQRRLVQAAQLYMQKNRLVDVPVRFDVVTVKVADSETIVEYYPDAFPAG